jgi:hypothetical protein
MSALDKEKIFEELRNYHTQKFTTIKNPELNDLRTEFVEMEDRIVGMILSLVNGKAEFSDATKELVKFQKKLERTAPAKSDEASRNLFVAKIGKLENLLAFAKKSDFKLKKIRPNKYANRIPTNKITVS